MLKLIPPIPKEYIIMLLPDFVDQSKIMGELIELEASAGLTPVRKRFFRLRLDGSPDLHLSYGHGLNDTYERSKALNIAMPQYTCKPVFIAEDGERYLFAQEFFDGTPIDEKYASNKISNDDVSKIISNIQKTFNSLEVESTHEEFFKEFETFKKTILKNDNLHPFDKDFLNNYVFPYLEDSLLGQSSSKRWSPGDLAARNILVDDELSFKIIDCEFAHYTHFHDEDWIRLGVFSSGNFKEIPSVKQRFVQVDPWYHIYLCLRQTWLNRTVWQNDEYQQFASEDLHTILKLTESFGINNKNVSLLIRGVLDASRKSLNRISVEKDIRVQKENELTAEKQFRLQKESQLDSEKELRLQIQSELTAEKQFRLQKESQLDSEKELRLQIDKELDQEKQLRISNEAELNFKIDKINRMERSFSWKVTGFLRYFRRQFLDKEKNQKQEHKSISGKNFTITHELYLKSILFPNLKSKNKEDIVIIIPVYFALEYLSKCIISIEKYYPHIPIFIIDDSNSKSESNKLKELLGFPNTPKKNLHLITNNENIGFVQSVNKAVLEVSNIMSPKHILLLNSDTELTEGCIDEMRHVIETSDRHGAVSPRSNNASIQTFPFSSQIDIPDSYDLWNRSKHLLPRYHIIPTCVGFCMLIKYDLIKRYGMFSEIYGKGYNEENDFCCRINRYGYSSISSNHAYVFHHSSKSFDEEEKKLLDSENRKKLDYLYPEYSDTVSSFFKRNRKLFLESTIIYKKSIVFDLQDIPNYHNGTSEFALTILTQISKLTIDYNLYILINQKAYRFHKYSLPKNINILFKEHEINNYFNLCFRPMQFFSRESLDLSRSICDKLIFVMQDIIALRTNSLCSNKLINIFRDSIIKSDKIIAISNFVSEDMKHYFSDLSPSSEVIHHGLPDKRTSRKDEQYILVVGNKFHHKSLKECIYKIKDINYKFKVIGLDNEFLDRDNIEYIKTGNLKEIEIENLYEKCSLILYPSSYEGFGLPISHSIRFSKHIICFKNQLNYELFERFKFFKGIKLISSFDEMEYTISKCRNIEIPSYTIPEEFTWENTSKKYIKTFTEVLN